MELQIKAALAGIAFGIWPLLMNRSGLNGNFASLLFTIVILVFVAPFAIGNVPDTSKANWPMLVGAGIISGLGLLAFNAMLTKATVQNVSSLFVIMIVVQISLPAIYDIAINGGMTATKSLGFILALGAAILLTKQT